jgi:hypothetical protein
LVPFYRDVEAEPLKSVLIEIKRQISAQIIAAFLNETNVRQAGHVRMGGLFDKVHREIE